MKISSSSTDTPPPKRSSSFLNTATEAELEKPGTLPEMNEYRLSVAATRHPGYIEWIVLPIGRTFAGGKIIRLTRGQGAFMTDGVTTLPKPEGLIGAGFISSRGGAAGQLMNFKSDGVTSFSFSAANLSFGK